MGQCTICDGPISREEKFTVSCNKCRVIYHGKCCGLNDREIDVIRSQKKTWVCKKCDQMKKTGSAKEKPVSPPRSYDNEPSPSDILVAVNQVNEDIKNLKSSMEKYGELSFELNEKFSRLENHLEGHAKRLEELTLENKGLRSKVGELEIRVSRAEQNLLCRSVEIRGIPVRAGETPSALVASVGAGLGIKISVDDIDIVERRRPKKDDPRPPPVIARFVRQTLRDELVQRRKVKRDFSTRDIGWQENDAHRIYLSEEMTPFNRRLYWLARQKRAAGKLKYVWFSAGRVRCRKEDGHPVIFIDQPQDLEAFC